MKRLSLLLLLGSTLALGQSMGPLTQSANTNFFKRPDGKTIVLTGTHTWNTFQDTDESSAPQTNSPLDFNAYVAFLVNRGHNVTILWRKDLPTYCSWGADGGGTTWHMTMWPWNRTGPSNASDGLLKFDLTVNAGNTMGATSLNQAYFDRLLARVQTLQANGIYAIVELFDGLGISDNRCTTDGYPFTSGNNINSLSDGYTSGLTGTGSMTMGAANGITAVQEAYVKKVIDTLNAQPNVIWEISEEAPLTSTWWEGFMIDLIHKYEAGGTLAQTGETFTAKSFQHPVLYPTLNVEVTTNDTTMLNSDADAVSLFGSSHVVGTNKCGSGSPACKVSITDSDHNYFGTMWTDAQQAVRNALWKNFVNGNSYIYMDPYVIWWPTNNRNLCNGGVRPTNAVCTTIVSTASGWQENVRRNLGYIATYGNNKLNLTNATPQPSLCQTGFCLAYNNASAAQFLVYFPSGGANWVNLSAQNGHTFRVEWFDPATGNTFAASDYTATSGTTTQTFTPPTTIATDAVLLLTENPWAGIIDPARAASWTGAGVQGGIPNRTTICSTLNPGATAAQINSAISACPAGQVVFLTAGTYSLTAGISMTNNVTLRGAGADQTFLSTTGNAGCGYTAGICIAPSTIPSPGDEKNVCDWTVGYAKGSTTITIANCGATTPVLGAIGNLKVGSLVVLDQLDETADTGQIWNCLNSTTEGGPQCSNNGTGSGGGARSNGTTIACASCTGSVMKYRSQQQTVTVTSCDGNSTAGHACVSGTNITIAPGIYMPNWNSGQKPQAWYGNGYLSGAGVENLAFDGTTVNSNYNIVMAACVNCWVKGIRSSFANRSHITIDVAQHTEVRDSYFYQSNSHASVSYTVEILFAGSDNKVENNISQQVTDSMPNCNGGCEGNVFAYNFAIDDVFTTLGWMQAPFYAHASGNAMNLWEGNVGPGYTADDVHGTHHFDTLFRNRLIGNQAAGCGSAALNTCNKQTIPLNLYAGTRYYNIIGNVLGQVGYHDTYGANCTSDDTCFNTVTAIYRTGATGPGGTSNNGFCSSPSCAAHGNFDPQVGSYLMRWGNYDTVNGVTPTSINDTSGIRFVSAEVPSGLAAFSNAVPVSQTLPSSFYLSSTPAWFGSTTYPAIGPDVTSGNLANTGGHANMNPAMACYTSIMGGPADGTGSVLSFNANTCYYGGARPMRTLGGGHQIGGGRTIQ